MTKILTRGEWGAADSKRPFQPHPITAALRLGVKEVVLHHSVTGQGPFLEKLRGIQHYHLNHPRIGYSGIAYNAMVSNLEPLAAIGRGPTAIGGATYGANSTTLSICAIGNFEEEQPTEILASNIVSLLRDWIANGWVDKDFSLVSHGDMPKNSTLCCGKNLARLIPGIERQAKATRPSPLPASTPSAPASGGLEEIETQTLRLLALVREERKK
jgi:hypothetical protein